MVIILTNQVILVIQIGYFGKNEQIFVLQPIMTKLIYLLLKQKSPGRLTLPGLVCIMLDHL
jgi:hypothetical protein